MLDTIFVWLIVAMLWSGIGALILFSLLNIDKTPVKKARGLEFVDPWWIWTNFGVNVFGAILIAAVLGILCPPATVGYWLYKMCVTGKNNND